MAGIGLYAQANKISKNEIREKNERPGIPVYKCKSSKIAIFSNIYLT